MGIELTRFISPLGIPPTTGYMPIAKSTRLGPYEVIYPLGSGGMGEVYLAEDTRLGKRAEALQIIKELEEMRARA